MSTDGVTDDMTTMGQNLEWPPHIGQGAEEECTTVIVQNGSVEFAQMDCDTLLPFMCSRGNNNFIVLWMCIFSTFVVVFDNTKYNYY